MKILIILVFSILIFLGLIIYEEMTKSNLVDDVQEFISNITFEDSSSGENIIQAKILENVQITENYEKQENHYFFPCFLSPVLFSDLIIITTDL